MKNKSGNKKKNFSKATLKRLDRLHKKSEALFKEDEILLRELRKEINAQLRRKAS